MREPWLPASAVCGFGRDQGDAQPARSVDPSSGCVREMALYVRGVGGSDSVRGQFRDDKAPSRPGAVGEGRRRRRKEGSQVRISKHEEALGSDDGWILKGNRAREFKKVCRFFVGEVGRWVVSP